MKYSTWKPFPAGSLTGVVFASITGFASLMLRVRQRFEGVFAGSACSLTVFFVAAAKWRRIYLEDHGT